MKKLLSLVLTVILCASVLAACGSQPSSGDSAPSGDAGTTAATSGDVPASIKVGVINPTTGPLALMSEGTPYLDEYFRDYVNNELGGIYISDYDATLPIELVIYDSASNSDKSAEMTTKLITEDKVDVILVRHVPDNVVPATVVAEQYGVPIIGMDCPAEAWIGTMDEHVWSFVVHANGESYWNAYKSTWESAGYGPGQPDSKLGWVFGNDLDGTVLAPTYKVQAEADGYEVLDPGLYSAGTNDYSSLIKQFKDANIEVLFGVMTNPEFATFWTQCLQLDFKPNIVTFGKAFMLESQAEAIGTEIMDGICNEVWWDVRFPYASDLMGVTAAEFGDEFYAATGLKAASPQGAKFTSYEILIDSLMRCANLEPETIRDAIRAFDRETIMGPVKFDSYTANYCPTAVVGGQWQLQEDGTLSQEIISNPDPSNGIEVTAKIKTSGRAWE